MIINGQVTHKAIKKEVFQIIGNLFFMKTKSYAVKGNLFEINKKRNKIYHHVSEYINK